MRQIFLLTILAFCTLNASTIIAQTEWMGSTTSFTKSDNADWTLEANQDRITDNVWITRANNKGIFNIVSESSYVGGDTSGGSPAGTEWAFGTIADGVGTLTFTTWATAMDGDPPSNLNNDMVLHLITDDIYIDIKFTSWSENSSGGGFTYERSTDPLLSTIDLEFNKKIKLFPNPSSDFLQISGLTKSESYKIYNIIGSEIIVSGNISNNETIDIKNFTNGLYFLKFNKGDALIFLKE